MLSFLNYLGRYIPVTWRWLQKANWALYLGRFSWPYHWCYVLAQYESWKCPRHLGKIKKKIMTKQFLKFKYVIIFNCLGTQVRVFYDNLRTTSALFAHRIVVWNDKMTSKTVGRGSMIQLPDYELNESTLYRHA